MSNILTDHLTIYPFTSIEEQQQQNKENTKAQKYHIDERFN